MMKRRGKMWVYTMARSFKMPEPRPSDLIWKISSGISPSETAMPHERLTAYLQSPVAKPGFAFSNNNRSAIDLTGLLLFTAVKIEGR